MTINTNAAALNTSTLLAGASARLDQALRRLSSGSKISSPADDSGGLAVSMKLNAQIARLNAVANNINDAISFSQTQDGYLQKIDDTLARVSALAVLAMDPTKPTTDRMNYDAECQSVDEAVWRTRVATFNDVPLFDGKNHNVTIDADANTLTLNGVSTNAFNLVNLDNLAYPQGAKLTLQYVETALNQVASCRAQIGSNLETLSYYNNQVATLKNSLSAATSRITDVDVAQESTNYAKQNILVQAGTAMLAQANLMPQSVLKLLG
jgi:flagellin